MKPKIVLMLVVATAMFAVGNVARGDTVTREIQVENDDAEEYLNTETFNGGWGGGYAQGVMYLDSSDLEVGDDEGGTGEFWQVVALQYNQLGIPQGATITSATITFTVDEAAYGVGNSNDFTILAEAADNASVFSTDDYNITDRARTIAAVAWAPASATAAVGTTVVTSDISAVIQEVVDRSGWSDNNRLTLMIYPDFYLALPDPLTGGPGPVQTSVFEAGPGDGAAVLHIEWSLHNANGPNPPDGQIDVSRDTGLSWTAGLLAAVSNGQTLYFSESFDDVNDGVGGITQTATSHDPGRLNYGTTYYWRVRQNNGAPDFGVNESRVWSFTTELFVYPIPSESITATASSQASDNEGPEKTIDSSGLDPNDLHSADPKAMWISEAGDPGSASIQYEFDKPYKLHEMLVWNYNGDAILTLYGLKEVTIEYSTDGTNWSQLENVPEFAQAIGEEGYAANTTVAFNGAAAKYVKITANSNWGGGGGFFNQYGLSEIQFLAIPMAARKMNPADGTILPGLTTELSWREGRQAEFHDVYISTDMQAVIDGIAPVERVNTTQYTAELDLLGATYYWKVNEVNEAEVPAVWEGPVQSLTTSAFLVIENFDGYNARDNQIWWSWKDGLGYVEHDGQPAYTGNGSGSAVGDETTDTFMEMNIFQGGTQSIPVWYDNNKQGYAKYSETVLTLPAGKRDWTKGSPVELSLWFRGEAANTAERLYVAVSDTAVVYHEDLNAAQLASWTEWVIPLETLVDQGVSLTDVDSIAIGLGTRGNVTIPGGAGKMYIDNIRLNQPSDTAAE